jgi:FtsP/CotA-like multicopper oxidase with cupredoxin domain
MDTRDPQMLLNRRDLLKWGGSLFAAAAAGLRVSAPKSAAAQNFFQLPANYACAGTGFIEVFPTSPRILSPFSEPLPVLAPMQPVSLAEMMTCHPAPGPGLGQQESDPTSQHQIWPSQLGLPDPIFYRIQLQVSFHSFTDSYVQPIDIFGQPTLAPNGIGQQRLPFSCIYGFNGTFPGPMIYAKYGQPCLVRFENHLDENPLGWERCDFGADNYTFLTHLHNAHTAPESDGNPHHKPQAYNPGEYVDNLYLNYPAGNDPSEKQSFFWFHDHKMDFTGADVYKGMVGLFPIYDPVADYGNENDTRNKSNLRLPGVPNPFTGQIDYDVPLAFYDCALDDGVTQHKDFHNGCGETHPDWWGMTFFRHFPNHGFVGDIFTVNGKAYPVWEVKRRKYRLRFLDASIARIYNMQLMSSTGGPVVADDPNPAKRQGQFRIRDGQQCMKFTEIATDGGLLPFPIVRDAFELWPAKRREAIVDFSRYMDGTPTTKGDVIYLVNTRQMTTGRKPNTPVLVDDQGNPLKGGDGKDLLDPDFEPGFCVPLIKIVIGENAVDNSVIPSALRPLPVINSKKLKTMPTRTFELQRSGAFGGEIEWLINGQPFVPDAPLATPQRGVPEVWTIRNGGGGWVHPMHLHYEEHRVLSRNGVATPLDPRHPDDNSREDVIALDPSEEVVIYRNFRTFHGKYVSHCHNLAHEDHAMMFGWTVLP